MPPRDGILFLLEVCIEQDGFRAGIIEDIGHGRVSYLLQCPNWRPHIRTAPSSWDARRRIRRWIKDHYERGMP